MPKWRVQTPQIIICLFVIVMMLMAGRLQINLRSMLGDTLVRLVMNGVLVLALIPMLNTGVGINFGLSVGMVGGLLGMALAVNFFFHGLWGLLLAIVFSLAISLILGFFYAKLLNLVKGNEEIAATFIGYSFIYIMNLFWAVFPFRNREMLWPIGGSGTRPSISLENYFEHALNDFLPITIGGIKIPVGMLLFFTLLCLLMLLFFRTKLGRQMLAAGENEQFAELNGISVRRMRSISIIMSTCLGALGICIYAQSYGFLELYSAPQMMVFPAVSAILMGGSNGRVTGIFCAVLGTYLLQSIYIFSTPLANQLLVPEFAEIMRNIITNSIILYALLHKRRLRA